VRSSAVQTTHSIATTNDPNALDTKSHFFSSLHRILVITTAKMKFALAFVALIAGASAFAPAASFSRAGVQVYGEEPEK
jgi:hypothetical protein